LGLDRNSALSLNVHSIQILSPHLTVLNYSSQLKHPICQRRFTVINVRNYAEIAYLILVG